MSVYLVAKGPLTLPLVIILTVPKSIIMIRYILLVAAFMEIATAAKLPNIVYIMTDDQDVELGGMKAMPNAHKLLAEAGAVGEHFYIQGGQKKHLLDCVISVPFAVRVP